VTVFSLILFTFEDIWFLLTGDVRAFETIFLPLAAFSSVLWFLSLFILAEGLPRLVVVILSASMASHVLLRFTAVPSQQIKAIAICRVLASLGLVLLYLRFRSEVAES